MECKDGQCVGKQCPDEPEPNPEPKAEPGVEPVADGSEPSAEPVTDSGKEVVPEVVEDSAPDTVVQDNGTTQDKTSGTDKGSKDGGSGDKAPEGGCNCETAQRTGTPWFWALLVLMVGFRRRRRG
jgi:MYXO-CTERM domain-containing protein